MKTYYKLVYKYLYEYRSYSVFLQPYAISYPPNSIIKAPKSGPIFIFDSEKHLIKSTVHRGDISHLYYYKVHALGVTKPAYICNYSALIFKGYSPETFWKQLISANAQFTVHNMYTSFPPKGTLVARVIKTLGEAIKL